MILDPADDEEGIVFDAETIKLDVPVELAQGIPARDTVGREPGSVPGRSPRGRTA